MATRMTKKTHRKLKSVPEMFDLLAKKLSSEDYIMIILFFESLWMGFDFGYDNVERLDQQAFRSFKKELKNKDRAWPIPFQLFSEFGKGSVEYELFDEDTPIKENKDNVLMFIPPKSK